MFNTDRIGEGLIAMGGCVPGIRVTVYLPPNLVGLKMSLLMVAMAGHRQHHHGALGIVGMRILRVAMDGPAMHREAGRAPRRSVWAAS